MAVADLTRHWSARLRDLAVEFGVPGAVLGIDADEQETVVAHGVLSTATQVETTPQSIFQIGSITKVWTATMIMQLVEAGRITLDTTVSEVMPDVRLGIDGAGDEGPYEFALHPVNDQGGPGDAQDRDHQPRWLRQPTARPWTGWFRGSGASRHSHLNQRPPAPAG